MDPDETLRVIRLTIKQMQVDKDPLIREAHARELAEHVEALDGWLSNGGFPPKSWPVVPMARRTDYPESSQAAERRRAARAAQAKDPRPWASIPAEERSALMKQEMGG